MDTQTPRRRGAAAAIVWLVVAALLPLGAQSAPAPPDVKRFRNPNGFTWQELALLPDYCYDAQGILYGVNESPRAAKWVGLMGLDFWHMHHYCQALRAFNRLEQAGLTPMQRNVVIADIDRNVSYMTQNCAPSNPLYPEFLLRLGDMHLLLNNLPAASEAFEQARQLKPDYWPAYTRWIDVLLSLKLTAKAKALAEQGLGYAPDAQPLREVYVKLGGKLASIKPAQPAASAPGSAASASAIAPAIAPAVAPANSPATASNPAPVTADASADAKP